LIYVLLFMPITVNCSKITAIIQAKSKKWFIERLFKYT
jgi:hypothetical protein